MTNRFTNEQLKLGEKKVLLLSLSFLKDKEIGEVAKDFEIIFPGRRAEAEALNKKQKGEGGKKLPLQYRKGDGENTMEQFKNFENIPFDCSSSLNLISVHPSLIEFARSALKTNHERAIPGASLGKIHGRS
ncbi:MAG: hypothetical protein Ct9H300mP20_21500 [Gammaproteobacteria bacterium]|nr:MAG: hypothetical protein Ct9H300mP20_21500 [Gammaproteobacteria bacterium]